MNKIALFGVVGLAFAFGCLFAGANDKVLLADSFQEESTGLNLNWRPMKTSQPWVLEEEGVVSSGMSIFDYLETSDFVPIADGSFDIQVKVKFESAISGGDNRFFIKIRDGQSENRGFELFIAQGTANNTYVGLIGGGASSKELRTVPFTFPPGDFVEVRWVCDRQGKMQVYVDRVLYLELDGVSLSSFDRVSLGTRAYVSEGDSAPSALRHFFRDFQLLSGPETLE